MNRLGFLAGLR